MKVRTYHLNGSLYRIGRVGSDCRHLPGPQDAKVVRIRPGLGKLWYQVQLTYGDQYCDVFEADLICESQDDEIAIAAVTPRALPDYIDV
jgi:hypothetical protein